MDSMSHLLCVLVVGTVVAGATVAPVSATATSSNRSAPRSTYVVYPSLTRPGDVLRWNPCTGPITYSIDTAGLSSTPARRKRAAHDIRRALKMVTKASGLRFTKVQETAPVPQANATWRRNTRAHLRIVFTTRTPGPFHTDLFDNDAPAVGMTALSTNHRDVVTDAAVVLDADAWTAHPSQWKSDAPAKSNAGVLLHEFGHAVGLGHTKNARQLMRGTGVLPLTRFVYQPGDREGLARVGASRGCTR